MSDEFDRSKAKPAGHSATVQMWLHIGSVKFPVLQSSKEALKVKDAHTIRQGDAVLEIIVDGRPRRWPVRVLPTSPRPNWISIVDR